MGTDARATGSPRAHHPGHQDAGARRRGVLRRALRRETSRLRDRQHLLAIALLAIAGGLGLAGMWARGELGGGDARAYWAAVRIWLNGGDPYHPTGPFMPYVYAPWLLPFFLPWALLPMDIAWFVWRGASLVLLGWTVVWAYRRRPLMTAVTAFVLAFPIFANLDTGNINIAMVLFLWGAQFTGPRTAGLLWAIATAMKWVPIVFLPFLAPRGRYWGVIFLAISALLTVLMLPLTLVQLHVLFAFPRPPRFDYVAYLWALVPWLWRKADPLFLVRPAYWRAVAVRVAAGARRWGRAWRESPSSAMRAWVVVTAEAMRRFFGFESPASTAAGSTAPDAGPAERG
jgi:hypothetical protein